jgi:ABC-type nickel/cobalt efflux system permease component RcnA
VDNTIFLAISIPLIVLFTAWMIRSAVRVNRAHRMVRKHHYKMLRDGFICVKCGYNVRGCTDKCAECGWPLDQDPD